MTTHAVTVRDDLALEIGHRVVAHLRADEALDLAAALARSAFRRIAFEEGADALFDEAADHEQRTN